MIVPHIAGEKDGDVMQVGRSCHPRQVIVKMTELQKL